MVLFVLRKAAACCMLKRSFSVATECEEGYFSVATECEEGYFSVATECEEGYFSVATECEEGYFSVATECEEGYFSVATECEEGYFSVATECKEGYFSVATECEEGYFGSRCDSPCRCKGSVMCNRHNGYCPSGCGLGWMGRGCQNSKCFVSPRRTRKYCLCHFKSQPYDDCKIILLQKFCEVKMKS